MTISRRLLLVFVLLAVCILTEAAEPRPLIVAHRGLLHHAPENTLVNFRACLELRLGFEFDVLRTGDGHLVCIHDETVDRTTDGEGNVADLTLNEIRRLDAGSWFDPQFAGERIPTVEEVLQLVAEYARHDVLIAVDLKVENVEQDVVRLAEKHKILHRLLFIGRTISEPNVRDGIKQASTAAQTAAVVNNPDEFSKALAATNADWVHFGVLDHVVTLPDGQSILNPMRVVANGNGSELMFTLFQLPDMSDEQFAKDAGMIQADLRSLKAVLEGSKP